jgi:GNAT superfamily N-acetyltransferase
VSTFFSPYDHCQHWLRDQSSNQLGITVRGARQNDLSDLVEIISSSFHPRKGAMRWLFPLLRMGIYEDLRYRLKSPSSNSICLVAIVSKHRDAGGVSSLAGTIEIAFYSTYPLQIRYSYYPYLSNLAVHIEHRRQGIARKLLAACEEIVKERGFQDLYLHVLEENYQARQLYVKAGYRVKYADPYWFCLLFQRPRRLLLHKRLSPDELSLGMPLCQSS